MLSHAQRNENPESRSSRCTRRASHGRGSSLTLGNRKEMRTDRSNHRRVRTVRLLERRSGGFGSLVGTTGIPVVRRVAEGSSSGNRPAVYPMNRRFSALGPVRLMAAAFSSEAIRDAVSETCDSRPNFDSSQTPNKAPEPTRGSVTPRAVGVFFRMKTWTENRFTARGAPAPRVAHL